MSDEQQSPASGIFCEFLQLAVYGILCTREIYPLGAFERQQKYGVPVQVCTHPAVVAYVDEVIGCVKRLLDAGTVQQVAILIIDSDRSAVEKFVFEVARVTKLSSTIAFDELYLLEQSLRGALMKLYVCHSLLSPLPAGCTWTVEISTRRSSLLEIRDKQLINEMAWIMKEQSDHNIDEDFKIIPLKSVTSNCFTMQMFIEDLRRS